MNPRYLCPMLSGMDSLVPRHVVFAGESPPTFRALMGLDAVVVVYVTLQINFAGEIRPTDIANEFGPLDRALIQESELGLHCG